MLTSADGRRFLVDRRSRLGTMVDARMIGGGQHVGHVELRAGAHEVRIGGALTPYRFSMN
jgi:hypothetical protein